MNKPSANLTSIDGPDLFDLGSSSVLPSMKLLPGRYDCGKLASAVETRLVNASC